MEFQNYIKTELLILIPALYFIGIGLKKSKVTDKWIPFLLGGSSILLSTIWVLSTCDIGKVSEVACAVFTSITQGILLAGTSVYANQLYLQLKKDE